MLRFNGLFKSQQRGDFENGAFIVLLCLYISTFSTAILGVGKIPNNTKCRRYESCKNDWRLTENHVRLLPRTVPQFFSSPSFHYCHFLSSRRRTMVKEKETIERINQFSKAAVFFFSSSHFSFARRFDILKVVFIDWVPTTYHIRKVWILLTLCILYSFRERRTYLGFELLPLENCQADFIIFWNVSFFARVNQVFMRLLFCIFSFKKLSVWGSF